MKRFSLIIAVLVFSISLFAQPFPTTFKSVQITGSYEAVAKQLAREGFIAHPPGSKVFYGTHLGRESILNLKINKELGQVWSFALKSYDGDRCSAEEISEMFNTLYDVYEKDPLYTSDRANKKAKGAASFDPSISIGRVFQAKFYQDGDQNRLVEVNIERYQVKYHFIEIKYINCYNQGKNK
jgi:hypothetical protein